MKKRRLLLVDDEAALLRLMQTYLERLGYEVRPSANSEDASAALQEPDAPFELAIVDLSLMNGRDSLIDLAGINPQTRVLVCSGNPFQIEMLPRELQPRFAFLQKPFLPKMLADAVQELLDRDLSA